MSLIHQHVQERCLPMMQVPDHSYISDHGRLLEHIKQETSFDLFSVLHRTTAERTLYRTAFLVGPFLQWPIFVLLQVEL